MQATVIKIDLFMFRERGIGYKNRPVYDRERGIGYKNRPVYVRERGIGSGTAGSCVLILK